MAAPPAAAPRPNGKGGWKRPMIFLTVSLIIFAKAEVAELGAAWVMASAWVPELQWATELLRVLLWE